MSSSAHSGLALVLEVEASEKLTRCPVVHLDSEEDDLVLASSSSSGSSAMKLHKGRLWKIAGKRTRAAGGGRKRQFPDVTSAMKHWVSMERSRGHTVSKVDLLQEFLARLQAEANLSRTASKKATTPLRSFVL